MLLFLATITAIWSCKSGDPSTTNQSDQPKQDSILMVEKSDKGDTTRLYYRVKGKKEGWMKDYYNNGQLRATKFFIDDLQEGKTSIYYEDGSRKEVQYYKQGKRNGPDTIWHDNGKIRVISTWSGDKQDGEHHIYDLSGNLIRAAKYKLDTLIEVNGKAIKSRKF
jgi:uncharacterized protein